eukprot:CAMPEP_0171173684 /NCGR_PEP_ID=MMETSP0790-20130122/10347_1 /TAXON_ID=2925 /ORGANISM="Alexandrium catenella, Strain OF101" /LENGTH=221 /DNA_ID=CAMNT_0011638551 /DNA_START=47 /DNA_END=712 /DNA_ORIENTATION=-
MGLAYSCAKEVFGAVGHYEAYAYTVVKDYGSWSLRRYQPAVAAQMLRAKGDDDKCFITLARYIGVFSTPENTARQVASGPESIAMTVPVVNTGMAEPIAMTVPVVNTGEEATTMQFVLPSKYQSPEDAPLPSDPSVKLVAMPEREAAAMCFKGRCAGMAEASGKYQELLQLLKQEGYRPSGPWELHRFNPPYTLAPFRTNEIVVPVQADAGNAAGGSSSTS